MLHPVQTTRALKSCNNWVFSRNIGSCVFLLVQALCEQVYMLAVINRIITPPWLALPSCLDTLIFLQYWTSKLNAKISANPVPRRISLIHTQQRERRTCAWHNKNRARVHRSIYQARTTQNAHRAHSLANFGTKTGGIFPHQLIRNKLNLGLHDVCRWNLKIACKNKPKIICH